MRSTEKKINASVVITTRNRKDDVLRAVDSCLAQRFDGLEVLVFDDASSDGSVDSLKKQRPDVVVVENVERVGYIVNRNRGFRTSHGDIVFSIDDDAYFASPDVVSETVRLFRRDESIGAVAIPYIEPRNRRSLSNLHPSVTLEPDTEVRGYIGCAHAVRRDVALRLGGYREFFVHQGEERDFCIRLREAGYRVVYGTAGYIVHMVSPKRESERVSYYGIRNRILFNWLNLPLPHMLARMFWDPVAMMRYRFVWNDLPLKLRALAAGYMEAARRFKERRPVSSSTYRVYMRLPGHAPEDLEEVPPPCRTTGKTILASSLVEVDT